MKKGREKYSEKSRIRGKLTRRSIVSAPTTSNFRAEANEINPMIRKRKTDSKSEREKRKWAKKRRE